MIEEITICYVITLLVHLYDNTCHHQGCAAQFEEVVGSTNLIHGEDRAEDITEYLLEVVGRGQITEG